jgi:hypothetical protein
MDSLDLICVTETFGITDVVADAEYSAELVVKASMVC